MRCDTLSVIRGASCLPDIFVDSMHLVAATYCDVSLLSTASL